MTFDSTLPTKLKTTQQWFGSIISRPINEESQMMPISPSGRPMVDEACDYIAPSPTLRPDQRIQIYNQQYWWRLLNTLHEAFPLVTRLFGYHGFNHTIAIPFLQKYPPNHWSLTGLGDYLYQWVEEEYHESDKPLIRDAVHVDWAFGNSFCAPQHEPLAMSTLPKAGDPNSLIDHTVYLQEHIHLFDLRYDIFLFREEFLKQSPEHWLDNEFPPLKKEKCQVLLYRNHKNDIAWKRVSPTEFLILQQFQEGTTIGQVCEWLETQEAATFNDASEHLHHWFQEWIIYQWLTMKKRETNHHV